MADINPSTANHQSGLEGVLDSLLVDITAVRAKLAGMLSGSTTLDLPSLNDGAGTTVTLTVTGAALGDFAQASLSLDLQGVTVNAYVSAADTVAVRFQNESGGTLDISSATLRARVLPQASWAAPAALTTTT